MTANELRNLTPAENKSTIPMAMWSGKKPCVSYLRVIGSKAYCPVQKSGGKKKFRTIAWEGVFVGYPSSGRGHKIWDPKTKQVYIMEGVRLKKNAKGGWWRKETSIDALVTCEGEGQHS